MKTILANISLVLISAMMATSANAQSNDSAPATALPATNQAGLAQVCRADVEALCAGMQPGDGKLGKCMRANRSKLSSGCIDALKARRGQRKQS